ncbi:hypothetical protein COF80_12995 [Bacillus toyonensis]|uniref:DUF2164 domain-containing protein n=1 Tax=Bacillus toyonensis TaxID=155322 RepID=A0AB73RXC5_9BACI|nr:hypothetical protein CN678_05500 [Bacillus toyonensis]PEK41665.1 hypothetical protein CN586_23240 [Bacillus toyonensis]PEM44822.1 hypothetical protein CN636_11255 [Bacillus toyonensis]PHE86145.1 hypothetical protein COF80_12995 [Bacillus toyonensis]
MFLGILPLISSRFYSLRLNKKFELDLSSLEAEYILEFMMKEIGPLVYNQVVEDACKTLRLQMDVIEEEIYVLQIPIK